MVVNKNIFPGEGFADPHAIVENGRVYLFCGRDKTPRSEDFCHMHKWTVISSADLINWQKEYDILPTDTYIGNQNNCWAGYIKKKNDKYYWYFSNKNYNTGVMVADSIHGPFVDALEKPLIEQGLTPSNSYDPAVFEENGKCTIFFGAGTYYCCELGDDMISLASEPFKIDVFDKDGNTLHTDDKPTVFKRGDNYYLAYGNKYAMSKNLKGPYTFMGAFNGGGHNDVFEFNGKTYLSYEFHDTNIYFRGVAVVELNFDENGLFVAPEDNPTVFHKERTWVFDKDQMHWFLSDGNDCVHKDNAIMYNLNHHIALRSPTFPGIFMEKDYKLVFDIENVNATGNIKILVDTVKVDRGFAICKDISTKITVTPILAGTTQYEVEIKTDTPQHLRCISLKSSGPNDTGVIKIKSIKCIPNN